MPFEQIKLWLEEEKKLGSPNPSNIVLATATRTGIVHSRVVAIREILPDGILFFTQRRKRKTTDMLENPQVSMTLWLPLQQKEIIVDGHVEPLSEEENEYYWKGLSRERQLLFSAYSPISEEEIESTSVLEQKWQTLSKKYEGKDVPRSECYVGFKIISEDIYFYTLGINTFSELIKYTRGENKQWIRKMLSP